KLQMYRRCLVLLSCYAAILDAVCLTGCDEDNLVSGNRLAFSASEVAAQVVNGGIRGRVILPLGGACRLSVVNGGINLYLPETVSAEFSAAVTNGSILVTGLSFGNWHAIPTTASAVLGDGDEIVDLELINGAITVRGY
ncbi:MAG: hypothetical protein ABIF77_17180, partial [bacterium]